MDGEEERRRRRAKGEQSYGGFNFGTLGNLTQLYGGSWGGMGTDAY